MRRVVGTTRQLPQAEEPRQAAAKGGGFKAVDQLLAQQGPLDDEQQDALITEFEQMQLRTARQARMLHPFGYRITGELRGAGADGGAMAAALLVQGLAMGACAWAMLLGRPKGSVERGCMTASGLQRLLLCCSLGLGILCAAYWLRVHYGMVQKFGRQLGARNELLWVPLAPPAYSIVCCWVVASLGSTGSQVIGLRKLRYTCHTA